MFRPRLICWHREAGDSGPTPNYDTLPHRPGADPLKDPVRPVRERRQVERLSAAAIAANHVQIADRRSAGTPLDEFINNRDLSSRLMERVALAGMTGEAVGEYFDY